MDEKTARAIFYPEAIAVVGASSNPSHPGAWYVQNLISGGFRGEVYPVNRKGGEVLGLKAYPDVKSTPGPVDYVIVCVPKEFSLEVLDDCAAKSVKVVQFFTAGFRESGEPEGAVLEAQIVAKARDTGLRVLGPNCAGGACPAHHRAFGPSPFTLIGEDGPVAFISHSSGLIGNIIEAGSARGIKFSKLAAFNNCCDLNELDFLEYVGTDSDTAIIGAYFEGTTNGRALFELMRKIARKKPLAVWKGGQTEAGARAAASHTGSIAGAANAWEVAVKQAGGVFIRDSEELLDTLLAFRYLSPFSGDSVAILAGVFTPGGGASVTFADECISQGFRVPPFRQAVWDKLKAMLGSTGTILRNPLDMGAILKGSPWEILGRTLDVVSEDPGIDVIMVNLWLSWFHSAFSPEEMEKILDCLKDYNRNHMKPLIVISRSSGADGKRSGDITNLAGGGIPTYDSIARASRALAHVREYSRKHVILS